MQKVTISASRSYDILIGSGLLATLGHEAQKIPKVKKVCIVSESNVYPLHGAAAEKSLRDAGFEVVSYVFPAGRSMAVLPPTEESTAASNVVGT